MTITVTTEITESDTRATRLAILEAQVCEARDDIHVAGLCGDMSLAFDAFESLATLLQHTLQELELLGTETSPRCAHGPAPTRGRASPRRRPCRSPRSRAATTTSCLRLSGVAARRGGLRFASCGHRRS